MLYRGRSHITWSWPTFDRNNHIVDRLTVIFSGMKKQIDIDILIGHEKLIRYSYAISITDLGNRNAAGSCIAKMHLISFRQIYAGEL